MHAIVKVVSLTVIFQVAHAFLLGTKYSSTLDATLVDATNNKQ